VFSPSIQCAVADIFKAQHVPNDGRCTRMTSKHYAEIGAVFYIESHDAIYEGIRAFYGQPMAILPCRALSTQTTTPLSHQLLRVDGRARLEPTTRAS
jgi:hypothetical protein